MLRRLGRMTVAAVAGPDLTAPAALATTIKVSTTADTLASRSGCSLRAAVIASNTDTATAGCKAGAGADVIRLAKDATYTFAIDGASEDAGASGDLDVTGALTIKGNGATIDAAGLDRVISVLDGGTLKLANA